MLGGVGVAGGGQDAADSLDEERLGVARAEVEADCFEDEALVADDGFGGCFEDLRLLAVLSLRNSASAERESILYHPEQEAYQHS